MTKLIIDALINELVTQFSYPQEVLSLDHAKLMAYYLHYAVWDVEHGTVLKLTENCEVVQAVHGTAVLSAEDIIKLYGDPPVFHNL